MENNSVEMQNTVKITCDFSRALIHLKEGRKVTRASWPNACLVLRNNTIDAYKKGIIKSFNAFSIEDILAQDWIIL